MEGQCYKSSDSEDTRNDIYSWKVWNLLATKVSEISDPSKPSLRSCYFVLCKENVKYSQSNQESSANHFPLSQIKTVTISDLKVNWFFRKSRCFIFFYSQFRVNILSLFFCQTEKLDFVEVNKLFWGCYTVRYTVKHWIGVWLTKK